MLQNEIAARLYKSFLNSANSMRTSIFDSSGKESFNGIFGEQYMALRKPKFSANFNYTPDTRTTTTTIANGGSAGVVGNLLTLQTSTATNGTATIFTKENLRYSAGRDAEMMFTAIFTTPKANSNQRCGIFDTQDGFYIGYENLEFGISVRKNGSNLFVKQPDFNKDKLDGTGSSKFVIDQTKMNIFRITYGYLGIAPCFYQIYGGSDIGWITFHIHDVVNKQAETHISKPYLPLRAEVNNTGNNTNIILKSGSVYAGVIDGSNSVDSSSREFSAQASFPGVTAGTDKPLICFHNKATFSGTTNKIDDLLVKIGLSVDGTKTVRISLYKLASAPTGGTWTDVNTANSNMEVNTTATISLTNAQLLDSWALAKTDSINTIVSTLNYLLLPDEYAAFTFTSTGTSDVEFVNRWSELF